MKVGVGFSTQAAPIRAVFEAVRAAAATVPPEACDVALVFAAGAAAAAPEELAAAAAELTGASLVIGASAAGVGVDGREVEGDAVAVALLGGARAHAALSPRLGFASDVATSDALRDLDLEPRGAALLLFDATTVSPTGLLDAMRRQVPADLPTFGLGAVDLGGSPWVTVGEQPTADALAALWLPDVQARWAIAPIGQPLTPPLVITGGMGGVISTLDDRRAYDRLVETVKAPMMENLDHLGKTILIGLPGPDGAEQVRPLLGVDPYSGAIAIGGDTIQAGQAIRFILRSPDSARENLRDALRRLQADLDQPPALLLAIRGAGRGRALYGDDLQEIEPAMIAAAFPGVPVLTVMSACELAPTPEGHAMNLFTTLLVALR